MTSPTQTPSRTLKNTDIEKLKSYLINTLTAEYVGTDLPEKERRQELLQRMNDVFRQTGLNLPDSLRTQIFRDVIDELIGYGPIQPLLDDPEITEVMVNGCFAGKNNRRMCTQVYFLLPEISGSNPFYMYEGPEVDFQVMLAG